MASKKNVFRTSLCTSWTLGQANIIDIKFVLYKWTPKNTLFLCFFKILLHKGTYCYTLGSPCVPQKTQGGTNTIIIKYVLCKRILRRNFG